MIHLTVQQLSAALDGALTGPSLELVVRHLAACHDCRDRQARLAKHDDALRRLLSQDPGEAFIDELSARAEAWVMAIARGMPEPVPHASVPLQHEEDPANPVEPPAPPPRPELGRSAEVASEAGWGRIGLKPTASTNAPESDPEEAQRLLEALERGEVTDFTELTGQGMRDQTPVDGPVFDLPGWLQDPSRRAAEPRTGPREVPKLNVFFDRLDERAAGITRAAVDRVFRRDPPVDATPEADASVELPPGHAGYAPPGWRPPVRPSEPLPTRTSKEEPVAADDRPEAPAPVETAQPRPAFATAPRPVFATPSAPPARRPSRGPDRAYLVALTSVCGLALVLVALQMIPTGDPQHRPGSGIQMPEVRFRPNETTASASDSSRPEVNDIQSATTKTPTEVVVPPVVEPDPDPDAILHEDAASTPTTIPPVIEPDPAVEDQAPAPVTVSAPKPRPKPPAAVRTEPVRAVSTPVKSEPAPVVTAKDDGDWPLLCGVVTDASGQPIPGARITATEIAFSMRTDAKGRFCLSAPAGTQHLLVEAPGFSQTREAVRISNGQPELRLTLAR